MCLHVRIGPDRCAKQLDTACRVVDISMDDATSLSCSCGVPHDDATTLRCDKSATPPGLLYNCSIYCRSHTQCRNMTTARPRLSRQTRGRGEARAPPLIRRSGCGLTHAHTTKYNNVEATARGNREEEGEARQTREGNSSHRQHK
eukprot:2483255-Pyramimonas_sp.AAC.1